MRDVIINKVNEIEKELGIKVLYACESGSRAWGFPSPDSDYDVRFLYTHDLDWYLTLQEDKDAIDLPINDLLDINGWELRKALRLMSKSNVAILEWIQSPIVYKQQGGIVDELRSLGSGCFSAIAVMYHFLSMSKNYIEACNEGENVKLKKYFYALRTTMSCAWVRERKTMSPIEFDKTLELIGDNAVRNRILELIELKATKDESYLHNREPLLDDFLKGELAKNEAVASSLPSAKGRQEDLNAFLLRMVKP